MDMPQPAALITGASSGIGETFARELSRKGYRLILAARRRERLLKLAEELGEAEVLPVDLSLDSSVLEIEKKIASEPNLEFLINNAGFGVPGRFFETDIDALDRMYRVHVIAIERLTHAALKGMVPRGKGNVINVSSVAGFFTTLDSTSYSSTKAWINSFTEGLHIELKNLKSTVRVQALCPGFTHTEFHDVIKMDRSKIHKSLWMTSEFVVRESLKGLEKNRLFVIPGWRYRFFVKLIQFLPRSLKHFIALKMGTHPTLSNISES
ncbi:MAG: SDR family oxidoreductase [Acidobacteriota bacterium]